MKKAAIYARVSSQKQKDEETIGSQVDKILSFSKEKGFEVPQEWIFKDEGVSGSTLRRASLENLRDLAFEQLFDTLFVLSPDRLARKYHHQALLLEEFKKIGLIVKFVNAPSSETAEDQLLIQIQGMFAEYERAQITERCRRGKKFKAQQGSVNALSTAPYGFRYIKKNNIEDAYYEIIDREAEVVRFIFHLYARERLSMAQIIKQLKEKEILSPKGNPVWCSATIRGMLKNHAYTGTAYFGRRVQSEGNLFRLPSRKIRLKGKPPRLCARTYKNIDECIPIIVPKIIEQELFQTTQELFLSNKALSPRNTKKPSLLQGLISCGSCGYSYKRNFSGRTTEYYRCKAPRDRCQNKGIRLKELDNMVWDSILNLLKDPNCIRKEVQQRLDEVKGDHIQKQQHTIKLQLQKLEKEKDRLLDAYQSECISLEALKDRMSTIKRRENSLKSECNKLSLNELSTSKLLEIKDAINLFSRELEESKKNIGIMEKQKILRMLVEEIVIYDEQILVKHVIPLEKKNSEVSFNKNACLTADCFNRPTDSLFTSSFL
jgi:site-specific DNA recombinase